MAVGAILFSPALLISAGPNIAFGVMACEAGISDSAWMLAFFFPLFLACLALEIYVVRRLIHPDTLVLSESGWTMTRLGRTSNYRWADYGEPVRRMLAPSKAVIQLDPWSGGKPVWIPGEDYSRPMAVVFDAVRDAQAKAGLSAAVPRADFSDATGGS